MRDLIKWLSRAVRYPLCIWIWRTVYYACILSALVWIYGIQTELHGTVTDTTFIYNGF